MKASSRRTFLKQSGDLGLLTLLSAALPRTARPDPLGIPIGIQLWSVNESMKSDAAATLRQLRKIGYKNVETAGLGELSAKQFRQLLDDAGLVCPSAHLDFRSDIDALIDDAHALGAQYAVSALLRPGTGAIAEVGPTPKPIASIMRAMTLEDAKQTAELANRMGEKAKQAGLQYAYHNHFFEFVDQGNGAVAYDVLLRESDPELVKFEIDCGWMMVTGRNPADYLKKYPHRFPMIHVKDFLPVADQDAEAASPGLRVGAELGRGFIDYRPIFSAAKAAGLKYYFAEQEGPFTRMNQLEAAGVSYGYLHSISE